MTRVLILSGADRYSDPWHPYTTTSTEIAKIVRSAGFEVTISTRIDEQLADLNGVSVLVVNSGDPNGPSKDILFTAENSSVVTSEAISKSVLDQARVGLTTALKRGLGVLVMHSGVASLRDYPAYTELLGGSWVRDVSWHPPHGIVQVLFRRITHPVTSGLRDFTLLDERYTNLLITAPIEVLAEHEEAGQRYPLIWARSLGNSRLIYDALGHDARSYESAEHRRVLVRALNWLLITTTSHQSQVS